MMNMNAFEPSAHPRVADGRFAVVAHPESFLSLNGTHGAELEPGERRRYPEQCDDVVEDLVVARYDEGNTWQVTGRKQVDFTAMLTGTGTADKDQFLNEHQGDIESFVAARYGAALDVEDWGNQEVDFDLVLDEPPLESDLGARLHGRTSIDDFHQDLASGAFSAAIVEECGAADRKRQQSVLEQVPSASYEQQVTGARIAALSSGRNRDARYSGNGNLLMVSLRADTDAATSWYGVASSGAITASASGGRFGETDRHAVLATLKPETLLVAA